MAVPDRPADLPDAQLDPNSEEVLARRYLKVDENGEPVEEPEDMFWRVAWTIAEVEEDYGAQRKPVKVENWARAFYGMMARGIWLPNSPTLFNAGRDLGQLSACFVLPVEDNMESILGTLRDAGLIHKSGGGTGFAFSNLRREGARVSTTSGESTGPVSFMELYDKLTDVVRQGGQRRGANMAIMRVDHPDIRKFVHCKEDKDKITNFNISVAVTDEFMERALDGDDFTLYDYQGSEYGQENAEDLLREIAQNAWNTGEPGLFFIDEANRHNPVPHMGDIQSTNPCGEQALLPYDSCNLGSMNVGHDWFVREDGSMNWDLLQQMVYLEMRFLDNVVDANNYPLDEIREMSDRIRRVGAGVMGFADLLIKKGLAYDSEEARGFADKLASFLHESRLQASEEIAQEKQPFPEWEHSVWGPDETCARDKDGNRVRPCRRLRNANVDTVAPTGTISIIAGCSGGIEPIYSVAFERHQAGTRMVDVHDEVPEKYRDGSPQEITRRVKSDPDLGELFQTAHDIAPKDHVRMQAVWQKHVDNAISKTINLPKHADPSDVFEVYKLAYKLGCKGITVYRDGSRQDQALQSGESEGASDAEYTEHLIEEGVCPNCEGELQQAEGCKSCQSCGFSVCT